MKYPNEQRLIEDARLREFPELSAYKAAKAIYDDRNSRLLGGRTFYSIYSVVRRFDARQSVTV